MSAARARHRLISIAALIGVLAAVGTGYTEANTTAPSSIGSGTGRVTVTVTAQGHLSMRTTPFPAP